MTQSKSTQKQIKAEVNLRTMAIIGLSLMFIGFIFCIIETTYFHSKYLPESKSELTCDFISIMLCGMGSSLFLYAIGVKTIYSIKIAVTEIKINNDTELLDEDARWRIVFEHIIDCMFGDKVISILESEFTIERINSDKEESQAKLWSDVLDFISNQNTFGNTIDELKSKFTIKNK